MFDARVLAGFLLSSALVTAVDAQDAFEWGPRDVNPVPLEDDLMLPLPCGGSMAFRSVDVASTGFLDDARVRLGQEQQERAYKEDPIFAYVSGSFSQEGGVRSFYVGKYEVSQAQYAAINGACIEPRAPNRIPVTDISWFDALNAANAYSSWLLANHVDALPAEDGVSGYVRLPTEVEWEFAARGGINVDQATFGNDLFPMPDGSIAEYVWHQGAQSAGGRLRPMGLLRANPLGAHDMLGNASEMTIDLFRLNRRGRLHGQAGGVVIKGGDISLSASQMRTAYRDELPIYNFRTGQPNAQRHLGFRLVLVAPVVVSQERLGRIVEEWNDLPAPDVEGEQAERERSIFAQLLSARDAVQDEQLQRNLDDALRQLEISTTDRNDQRDRAIKTILRSGGVMGGRVVNEEQLRRVAENVVGQLEEQFVLLEAVVNARRGTDREAAGLEALARARASMEQSRNVVVQRAAARDVAMATYVDMAVTLASDYSDALVGPQLEVLVVELERQGFFYLIGPSEQFAVHVSSYRRSSRADHDAWITDLTGTNQQ